MDSSTARLVFNPDHQGSFWYNGSILGDLNVRAPEGWIDAVVEAISDIGVAPRSVWSQWIPRWEYDWYLPLVPGLAAKHGLTEHVVSLEFAHASTGISLIPLDLDMAQDTKLLIREAVEGIFPFPRAILVPPPPLTQHRKLPTLLRLGQSL
jgi:hypothetical protein